MATHAQEMRYMTFSSQTTPEPLKFCLWVNFLDDGEVEHFNAGTSWSKTLCSKQPSAGTPKEVFFIKYFE